MKHISNVLFLITLVLVISSCGKDENHLGKKDINEVTLWTFETDISQENSTMLAIPSIDENKNNYFLIQRNFGEQLYAYSVDNNGNKNWQQTLTGDHKSRLIYKNQKLFYLSLEPGSGYINCLNASDGNLLWKSKVSMQEYQNYTISVSNDAIFVGTNDSLLAFDANGNKITGYDFDAQEFYAISVSGNEVFAFWSTVNNGYGHLSKLTFNGSELTHNWTFDGAGCFSRDIAIDNDGNAYITFDTQGFYCIANDGTVKWNTSSDFIISSSNDMNSATVSDSGFVFAGGGTLYKYNQSGGIEWFINSDSYPTITVRQAPVLGKNGKLYYIENSPVGSIPGLRVFNEDGSYYWYTLKPATQNYGVLNQDGNYLVIADGSLYCISTSSGGLASDGWPKMYYDYGNTGAK